MIKAVILAVDDRLLLGGRDSLAAILPRAVHSLRHGQVSGDALLAALTSFRDRPGAQRDLMRPNAEMLTCHVADQLRLPCPDADDMLDQLFAAADDLLLGDSPDLKSQRDLLRILLEGDLKVAVAADLIAPEPIALRRLERAGMAAFVPELAFLAHSQNTHFSLADAALYAELVARIGVEPDEALFICAGEPSPFDAAAAIGAHVWRIDKARPVDAALAGLRRPAWRHDYLPRPLAAGMLTPQYRGNLAALYGLLSEVKPHQWRQRPDPEEWSILQILCHLAEAEVDVHQRRLRAILERDDPFLSASAPPGPDMIPGYDDGWRAMRAFHERRHETISLLSGLRAEDWQRRARHSIFGLTTLLEMAHFTAQHDRLHITQLCQTLGKCVDALG